MCLYPKLIENPKYKPSKRNGGNPVPCTDERKRFVPIGCGKCIECLKQKALGWSIRLNEELKVNNFAYFVTFTFAPQELMKLRKELHLRECNAVAGKAIRRFLERWRKKYKKSLKHWFITELGHEGTERIHLHGIIFSNFEITQQTLADFWKYGNVDVGDYCNLQTINYIVKYVHKIDNDHKGFYGEIFCSAGIGRNYIDRTITKQIHRYREGKTIEYYRMPNGGKVALPIYYRNHLFTEDQREELWVKRIEEKKRYVLGTEIENINTHEGEQRYLRVLKKAQEKNRDAGFGDDSKQWKKKAYNITLRMLNMREKVLKEN